MQVVSAPEAMEYEPFQEPIARWFALRGARALPFYTEWDFARDALPHHRMVASLSYAPLRVQYGQVGQALEKLYGKQISGCNLDELYNAWFRSIAYKGYEVVRVNRLPLYERRMVSTIIKRIGYHKIHLPFGGDAVEQVVTFLLPLGKGLEDRSDWETMVKETPWL